MYTHVSTSNEFTPTSLHFSTFEEIATLIFIKSTILFKVSQSQAWNRAKGTQSSRSQSKTSKLHFSTLLYHNCKGRDCIMSPISLRAKRLFNNSDFLKKPASLSIYLSIYLPSQSKTAFLPSFGQSQQTQTSSSSSSSRHETHTLHSTSLRSVCGKRLHVY